MLDVRLPSCNRINIHFGIIKKLKFTRLETYVNAKFKIKKKKRVLLFRVEYEINT